MVRDLKAGGAVGDGHTQPSGEHDRRQAIPLRANDGELPRDLGVGVVEIVYGSIHPSAPPQLQGHHLRGIGGDTFDLRKE
jgi:hypothetical protein